jgi:hypothetical protein
VIVLTNLDGAPAGPIAARIADLYLPQPETPERKPDEQADLTTAKALKEVLRSLAAGKAAPERFTGQAREPWSGSLADAAAFLHSLGPLKSFELESRWSPAGGGEARRYRAAFREGRWLCTFARDGNSGITWLGTMPDRAPETRR